MARRRQRKQKNVDENGDPSPMEVDEESYLASNLESMELLDDEPVVFKKVEPRKRKKQIRYAFNWTKRPGDYGFNKEVTAMMRERGLFIGDRLKTVCDSTQTPFAHTISAAWLAGPETPIDRLLVVHRTGSGKTSIMIHTLDLYFSDPRPKVIVFPNSEITRNFYDKLKNSTNQYSAFVQQRSDNTRHANTMNYFRSTLGMEGELTKRGRPGELSAPLRSITYSIAGGRQVFPKGGGRPVLPLFRIDWDGRNPFDNKIIIMDEIHNLIRPPKNTDAQLRTRLGRMREALYKAQGSVIVGLTATPFVKTEQDGHDLLKMIKGRENANTPTNEGFISYFNILPPSIYPKMLPKPMILNLTRIQMEPPNLKKYLEKAKARGKLSSDPDKRADQLFRLMNYCNMAGYYTQAYYSDFKKKLRSEPDKYATKLDYIAKQCMSHNKKCAVLIHRRLGYSAFEEVVKGLDPENTHRWEFMGKPKTEKERRENKILEAFNADDNIRGEKIRCLVLDAETYGEGIDLLGVRHFYMANPAPSYASYKQWEGRVLRACGYSNLYPSERNVTIEMFLAKTEDPRNATADMLTFDIMRQETLKMEKAMKDVFGSVASDRIILGL